MKHIVELARHLASSSSITFKIVFNILIFNTAIINKSIKLTFRFRLEFNLFHDMKRYSENKKKKTKQSN